MKKYIILCLPLILIGIITITACKHEPYKGTTTNNNGNNTDYKGFPDAVGKIIVGKCATAGCHNQASYMLANGLLLDSWEHLFDGSSNGAVVVAYRPEMSSLMYFVNPDTTNGDLYVPYNERMPSNLPNLTKEEYKTLKDWIAAGAPDKDGNIPFASNAATRQKIYMTQQACDWVAVIDAEKKVVMRYIRVGDDDVIPENPHSLRVSPKGDYAAVIMTYSPGKLYRINTTTDAIENQVVPVSVTGTPIWNVLGADSNEIMLCDYKPGGGALVYSAGAAGAMTPLRYYGNMDYPHGIARGTDTVYFSSQYGNTIYKRPLNNTDPNLLKKISIDGNPPTTVIDTAASGGKPNPHEIMLTPDGNKLIVTCQGSNEVKILNAHTGDILKTITTEAFPQELALSKKQHKIYFTCMRGPYRAPYRGCVMSIDYETYAVTYQTDLATTSMSQPHGITVDDRNDVVYVASTNPESEGPPPHHPTKCAGKNGYYQVFSSITLAPLNGKKYLVSVQPYSVDSRFKD